MSVALIVAGLFPKRHASQAGSVSTAVHHAAEGRIPHAWCVCVCACVRMYVSVCVCV